MHIETEYFIIESNKKLPYIQEVMEYLNDKMVEIMDFFELSILSTKKKIVIWNDINEYRKHIEQYTEYKTWMCADTYDGNINMLSVEECQKTEEHKHEGIEHFKTTIAHEFVHICHQEKQTTKEKAKDNWFWEALATNLGNPNQFTLNKINTTSNDLISDFNNIKCGYGIAYSIGHYMLNNYSKEQIMFYVENPKQLVEDTERILKEAQDYYNKQFSI